MSDTGPESTRSPVKSGLLIAAIAAAVVAAAYFMLARSGGEDRTQPATADSAAPYACRDCGAVFEWTPAEMVKVSKEGGTEGGRGGLTLRCPKCGKAAVRAAYKCPKDGSIFPRSDKLGNPNKCPKCGWQP